MSYQQQDRFGEVHDHGDRPNYGHRSNYRLGPNQGYPTFYAQPPYHGRQANRGRQPYRGRQTYRGGQRDQQGDFYSAEDFAEEKKSELLAMAPYRLGEAGRKYSDRREPSIGLPRKLSPIADSFFPLGNDPDLGNSKNMTLKVQLRPCIA